jgi:hypothetical protein
VDSTVANATKTIGGRQEPTAGTSKYVNVNPNFVARDDVLNRFPDIVQRCVQLMDVGPSRICGHHVTKQRRLQRFRKLSLLVFLHRVGLRGVYVEHLKDAGTDRSFQISVKA